MRMRVLLAISCPACGTAHNSWSRAYTKGKALLFGTNPDVTCPLCNGCVPDKDTLEFMEYKVRLRLLSRDTENDS